MSVMSVSLSASQAASDEDASDDKQTALRRRTVTGGRRRRRELSETGGAEEDSDSETAGQAQPSERTRQKKFSKYFKDLPEEVCTVRELSDQRVDLSVELSRYQASPVLWWATSSSRDISTSLTTILASTPTSSVTSPRYGPQHYLASQLVHHD